MCKAVGIERLGLKYPLLLGKKRGYYLTSKLLPKTLILLLPFPSLNQRLLPLLYTEIILETL
jgi:hypothetical protein